MFPLVKQFTVENYICRNGNSDHCGSGLIKTRSRFLLKIMDEESRKEDAGKVYVVSTTGLVRLKHTFLKTDSVFGRTEGSLAPGMCVG